MPPQPSIEEVASRLLTQVDLRLISYKTLQSLWAGYGYICQITASPMSSSDGAKTESLILKLITPPPLKANDEGHSRKILSYEVEQYFYKNLAPSLPHDLPVAQCLASINEHYSDGTSMTAMIMNDLRKTFPSAGEKRSSLTPVQVLAALDWLGGFHGFWWSKIKDFNRNNLVRPPLDEVKRERSSSEREVWLNGGYTYLATRRKEYAELANDDDLEWSETLCQSTGQDNTSVAEMVAQILAPSGSRAGPISKYETLIHGDVKSENLFTTIKGDRLAFYDFQYTGLGLGVCDLAKLFTCSVPLDMLVEDADIPPELKMTILEEELLKHYHSRMVKVGGNKYQWESFLRHWETALVDWLRFQASWGFWGNTEWLEARVRSILKDRGWRSWAAEMIKNH